MKKTQILERVLAACAAFAAFAAMWGVWGVWGAPGAPQFQMTAEAQGPIESELALITPVSKFIHDAALKAFADYAKEKWNVTVKVSAIPAGTPVAYGRIVE